MPNAKTQDSQGADIIDVVLVKLFEGPNAFPSSYVLRNSGLSIDYRARAQHRPHVQDEFVFLRCVAPFRGLPGCGVSQIVKRNMRRAGITAASYGSHILRHSAATEMLRRGVSLYDIGSVLRHRSADMSAYYAKVDMELLKQVVQPWPEVLSC